MSTPAEIVFKESEFGGHWDGRLVNPYQAIDRRTGMRVPVTRLWQPYWVITESAKGRFHSVLQGSPHPSSRRYRSHETLDLAQKAARKWAARRYRILGD